MSLEELHNFSREKDIPIDEDYIKAGFHESERTHQDLSRTASAGMFK